MLLFLLLFFIFFWCMSKQLLLGSMHELFMFFFRDFHLQKGLFAFRKRHMKSPKCCGHLNLFWIPWIIDETALYVHQHSSFCTFEAHCWLVSSRGRGLMGSTKSAYTCKSNSKAFVHYVVLRLLSHVKFCIMGFSARFLRPQWLIWVWHL